MVKGLPVRDWDQLQERLQRTLEEWFPAFWASARGTLSPALDLVEREDAYIVRVELPGVRKEEIRVMLKDNVLTIQGEKRQQSEQKGETHHRIERLYGSFSRSLTLPEEVDASAVTAKLEHGVLEIMLPKLRPGVAPKEVPIQ
ncbi:MAG: Hsp20/alpha crystallin family protein [Bacteroidota bacterium]|nr:Hsp20/alpha crystallin family protein [Bacteroidota bacterium]MDW8137845.1 Hsp20/alpha crystallin family protein [Bacteroidota bacterium]